MIIIMTCVIITNMSLCMIVVMVAAVVTITLQLLYLFAGYQVDGAAADSQQHNLDPGHPRPHVHGGSVHRNLGVGPGHGTPSLFWRGRQL